MWYAEDVILCSYMIPVTSNIIEKLYFLQKCVFDKCDVSEKELGVLNSNVF